MGRKVIGLVITPQALEMAVVKNGRKPVLLYCGSIKASAAFSGAGMLSDYESDLSALAMTIKDAEAKNRDLFKGADSLSLCINNPQTVVRPISLPLLAENEINPAVEYEISQNFPGVSKTHILSFKEYTRDKSGIKGIVTFSPRKMIEPYQKLLEVLDYRHSYIDVAPNAQAKAFSAFAKGGILDRSFFLCDIESSFTQFTIVERGKVMHSRQVPEGTRKLRELIFHGAQGEEADLAGLQEAGGLSEADVNSAIGAVYSPIAEQAQQTMDFYRQISSNSSLSQVCLIGEGSLFPKLGEYFASVLGIPVETVLPMEGMKADRSGFIRTFSAIGAAIRED